MTTFKALVDLVVAGEGVKAGASFKTTDEQAAPALAFGLAEPISSRRNDRDDEKVGGAKKAKRGTTRKAS